MSYIPIFCGKNKNQKASLGVAILVHEEEKEELLEEERRIWVGIKHRHSRDQYNTRGDIKDAET